MILAGKDSKTKITNKEVSEKTLECLKSSVPNEVPGIAFLSGGQSEIEATENLDLINKNNNTDFKMTFFMEEPATKRFKDLVKNTEEVELTQNIFNHRAKSAH